MHFAAGKGCARVGFSSLQFASLEFKLRFGESGPKKRERRTGDFQWSRIENQSTGHSAQIGAQMNAVFFLFRFSISPFLANTQRARSKEQGARSCQKMGPHTAESCTSSKHARSLSRDQILGRKIFDRLPAAIAPLPLPLPLLFPMPPQTDTRTWRTKSGRSRTQTYWHARSPIPSPQLACTVQALRCNYCVIQSNSIHIGPRGGHCEAFQRTWRLLCCNLAAKRSTSSSPSGWIRFRPLWFGPFFLRVFSTSFL